MKILVFPVVTKLYGLFEETFVTNSESDRIVKYSANSDMVNSVLTASFTALLSALTWSCTPLNLACFDSNCDNFPQLACNTIYLFFLLIT